MQKFLNIVRTLTYNTQGSTNLHRWGNHFNKSCTDRMDTCMSMQWNDYSSHSPNNRVNEIQTKKIDDEYGHLFQIKENNPNSEEITKNLKNYYFKSYSKKDFEKYFYLEITSSKLF